MDIETFHRQPPLVDVKSGCASPGFEQDRTRGTFCSRCALNGYHWRHVIDRLRHRRGCIAIDIMGLGYTELVRRRCLIHGAGTHVAEVLDALGVEKIDLIGND